jgi:hypothetical protein
MRASASLSTAAAFVLGLAAIACAGCGAPGEPVPPQPIVPQAVTDLAARQQGDSVILTFTLPTRSTKNEDLAGFPTVEIYRGSQAPGVAAHKTSTRLVYTIPAALVDTYMAEGRLEFRDPFHAEDLQSAAGAQPGAPAATTMVYMVRTNAARRHDSADSNVAETPVYPAPPPPTNFQANVTEHAIDLAWQAPASGSAIAGYRVYRGELAAQAAAPASAPPETDLAKMKFLAPLALLGPASETSFDDPQFEFAHTYVYSVRSVAQFGPDSIESADSAPVIVTPRDIFPPAAPTGLEAIFVPATPTAPADIELSWSISPESDLAGYNIYRSGQLGTPGRKLNAELLSSPAFRDMDVTTNGHYFYAVSAVDRAGNESPVSQAVAAEVPADSQ